MEDSHWHLSKTISVSHLITTVAMVISMVIYVGDIKEDVAIQGVEINNIKDTIDTRSAQHDEMFHTINGKLDKLFELIYKAKND